jgi:hypothetical protein
MQKRGATFHRDSCSFAAYMCPEPFLLKIWGNHTQPQTMIGDVSSAEAFDTPTRLAWSSPHLGCVSYSRSRTDLSLPHIHPRHAGGPLSSDLSSTGCCCCDLSRSAEIADSPTRAYQTTKDRPNIALPLKLWGKGWM